MLIDYHVHCEYSDDSNYPIEDVVKDAIALGIKELCFTDHVDYGIKVDHDYPGDIPTWDGFEMLNVDYPNYFKDIKRLQEKYRNQIVIRSGLEFGVQMHTIDAYEALYEKYPMDFILLSIHEIDDKEFWTNEYQKGKTHTEIYQGYYEAMYEVIQNFDHYSCLAHLDLIRRYLDKTTDAFEMHRDIITKILNHVIKHNKGIEINTSSVRYGIHGLTPSLEILKLYKELGGTIITIGSDSHQKDHLGFNIEASKQILRDLGYKHYCTFEKMQAIFHEL